MQSSRRDILRVGTAALVGVCGCMTAGAAAAEYLVYLGTYTRARGKGIYRFRFEPATGRVTPLELAAETPNPSFLAVHPTSRFLYACNEHEEGDGPGKNNGVSAFAVDRKSGALMFLNKVSCRGGGPAHVAVDRAGKGLIVSNYGSGSMAFLPVASDGRLREATAFEQYSGSGPKPQQNLAHAHGADYSPDNRFAIVAVHGNDRIMAYRLNSAKGEMVPAAPPFLQVEPGDGPRHVMFHPNGRFVYALNEISATVTVLAFDGRRGALAQVQRITTLPPEYKDMNATAELAIDRAGKFLYASNRGHDSIVVFAIDAAKGTLQLVQHVPTGGKTPRNFALDPSGTYLFAANQNSDNIVLFRADPATGRLTSANRVIEQVPEPSCVVFVPVAG